MKRFEIDWNSVIGKIIATVKWKTNAIYALYGAIGALINTANLFSILFAASVAYIIAGLIDIFEPIFNKSRE